MKSKPTAPQPADPLAQPEILKKVLDRDFANVLRKAQSGKPLTKAERAMIEERSGASQKPENLLTQNQLADKYGRDRRTVAQLLKAVKPCGMAGKYRLYRESDVSAMLKDVPPRGVARELREQLVAEQVRQRKRENDLAEGIVIPRAEVCAVHSRIIPEVDKILTRALEEDYPRCVHGLEVPQIRLKGREIRDEIMRAFNELGAMWKQ